TCWDGGSVTSNQCLVDIIGAPSKYRFNATAGVGGNISNLGTCLIYQGDQLTYYFTPEKGYEVKKIYVDGVALTGSDFENAIDNGY
ncbi:hypothetical protein, partial [Bradyrhizobium sp. 23AC]